MFIFVLDNNINKKVFKHWFGWKSLKNGSLILKKKNI